MVYRKWVGAEPWWSVVGLWKNEGPKAGALEAGRAGISVRNCRHYHCGGGCRRIRHHHRCGGGDRPSGRCWCGLGRAGRHCWCGLVCGAGPTGCPGGHRSGAGIRNDCRLRDHAVRCAGGGLPGVRAHRRGVVYCVPDAGASGCSPGHLGAVQLLPWGLRRLQGHCRPVRWLGQPLLPRACVHRVRHGCPERSYCCGCAPSFPGVRPWPQPA